MNPSIFDVFQCLEVNPHAVFCTCTEYLFFFFFFLLPRGNIVFLKKIKIHLCFDVFCNSLHIWFSRHQIICRYCQIVSFPFLWREVVGLGRYVPSTVVVEGLYHRKEKLGISLCFCVSYAKFLY